MPTYYEGDQGFELCFTVRNKDDESAFNIAGYTITFSMWLPGAAAKKVNAGAVVIDVAADGTCHWVVTAAGFDTQGSYNWELLLTPGAGTVITARGNSNIVIKEASP